MPELPTLVAATSTLTASTLADGETVTIGVKVYTFEDTLTDVDGHVQVGEDDEETLLNLKAAINLEAGAGTAYADSTTIHPLVKAVSSDATTLVIQAKIKGALGNQILTAESTGSSSWTSTRMGSGSGDVVTAIDDLRDYTQSNSEILEALNYALNFA